MFKGIQYFHLLNCLNITRLVWTYFWMFHWLGMWDSVILPLEIMTLQVHKSGAESHFRTNDIELNVMCYILDHFDHWDLGKYNALMILSFIPIGKHVYAPLELPIILILQDIVLTIISFIFRWTNHISSLLPSLFSQLQVRVCALKRNTLDLNLIYIHIYVYTHFMFIFLNNTICVDFIS